jgi:ribosomal protein L37AE/L43A
MPFPKKEALNDPALFEKWLSHQSSKCRKKWNTPEKVHSLFLKMGRPGKTGDKSPAWKGDEIKYNSLHLVLRRDIPKPDICTHCGTKPKRLELCNISGVYSRDPSNYIWLCTKCHRKMDGHAYKLMKTKTRHDLFFNQYYQSSLVVLDSF